MASPPIITSIVVSHNAASRALTADCGCRNCELRVIAVDNGVLAEPYNSNQLAEFRAFLMCSPDSINTPFVAFSSARMQNKTRGAFGQHWACELSSQMQITNVLSPYLIIQQQNKLQMPDPAAPPYAFLAASIYESVYELSNELAERAKLSNDHTILALPFCSTFAMSKQVYKRFYVFIKEFIERLWRVNNFELPWFSDWVSTFQGRESGLLLERAAALWFAFQTDLLILGTGFGTEFPVSIRSNGVLGPGWKTPIESNVLIAGTSEQYN